MGRLESVSHPYWWLGCDLEDSSRAGDKRFVGEIRGGGTEVTTAEGHLVV